MEAITRRDFIKHTAIGFGSLTLAGTINANKAIAQVDDMSRVVITKHHQATDGVKAINADNVQIMMDKSIKELTGLSSVADAWSSILTDFKKDHIIAIKVNAIASTCPTNPEVANAVVNGLISAGVSENNIIIYDNLKFKLTDCKYKYNVSDTG
ncbi:twin-arginine translocation signal domain-containing protein, partial [Candidatus Poribacteria bacterium]|nr:twin-arginine translocation signal domain-containing protein [Candidatus Poribacteria bacterium]